jgi:uncharacterized protein YceK
MLIENKHGLEAGQLIQLYKQDSFCCRAEHLLDMLIENKHGLEAGQLVQLYKQNSFCCRAEHILDMIVENKHGLEAGQLVQLYKQDSFCCRAEHILDMIVHRSHLVSLKAILIMFHTNQFCNRSDDAADMVIALSKYFTESMIRSLLSPYFAKHLDMLINNYKSSLPALEELWSSGSTCDDSINNFILSYPMYRSSSTQLVEQYNFRNKSKTWIYAYYNYTIKELLTMVLDAGFKVPMVKRKGKKCDLVDFLEEYDDGSNVVQ